MVATALGLNAYALTGEAQYKDWVLEYVEAWRQRTLANDGIIPTNIGLDGTIGGECDGKVVRRVLRLGLYRRSAPDRGNVQPATRTGWEISGFGNALLLSGEQQFVDVWRQMIDKINANGKEIDGQMMYPHMHGDEGWYEFQPSRYAQGAQEVYYWSMDRADLSRLNADSGWFGFLEGRRLQPIQKRRYRPTLPASARKWRRCTATQRRRTPGSPDNPNPIQPGHSERANPTHVGWADAAPRLAAALPSALL